VAAQLTANAAVTKTLDCSGSPDAIITTTISGKHLYPYGSKKGTGTPVPRVQQVLNIYNKRKQCQCGPYTFL
jgi:hypothetical protein